MVAILQGVMTGLKSASEISTALIGLKVASEVKDKVIQLQNAIISAQTSAFEANTKLNSLYEENNSLKIKIENLLDWKDEKNKYSLITPWNGVVVYALKKDCSEGVPPHWLCPNCYNDGQKSILMQQYEGNGYLSFLCNRCKLNFRYTGRASNGYVLNYA
jgi:hypothetical protein